MSSDSGTPPLRARLTSAAWWFRSADGELTVAQFPNPAIWVWLATVVARAFDLAPQDADRVADLGHGALLVWGLDELVRGASPFRRVLGAAILLGQSVILLR